MDSRMSEKRMPEKGVWIAIRAIGLAVAGCGLVTAAIAEGSSASVYAQQPSAAAPAFEIEALAGEPFGVARIQYPTPVQATSDSLPMVKVRSPDGEIFYPTAKKITAIGRSGPPLQPIPPGRGIGGGRLLGRITNAIRTVTSEEIEQTVGTEVWFLFRGDEPRTVFVGDDQRPVTLAPVRARRDQPHRKMLESWWSAYTDRARQAISAADYPPLVEHYLVSMLARRFSLPIPEELQAVPLSSEGGNAKEDSIASTLELIAGTEGLRNQILQNAAQGDTQTTSAPAPQLPMAPDWQAVLPESPVEVDVEIEEIARYVPIDSLYLRFGSFNNYLWFRDLTARHGGDIGRMITLRGYDYEATKRNEKLLQLYSSELSTLLGPTVIEDMAIIGHDLFLTDGPSIGVLIKARNQFLLLTSLKNDRLKATQTIEGATLKDVDIDGQSVSLLSTPDYQVRSFLITSGNYILVTSSEQLVREFIETSNGGASLADSPGFRLARSSLPQSNNYSIFAYFSDRFFQRLVSPQYQIELRRRSYAMADIALVQMAQLAAKSEGLEITEVDELIARGFLPLGMGQRPDGSGPIVAGDEVINSLRGKRSAFLPVADVELTDVTEEEFSWYQKRAEFYSKNWQQMDPVVVGVQRAAGEKPGTEVLQIHGEVAPLVPEKYGWIAEQLGPPTRRYVRMPADDIAWAQAYVVSDQLPVTLPPHHLFVGFKDSLLPNPADLDGLLDQFRALQSLSGYIGAWPQPGLLDRLPLGLGQGRPVGPGMSRLLIGLYRFQGNNFSVISFLPEIITSSLPSLQVVEAETPAQVRFKVQDLSGSQFEVWLNQQIYERNRRTCIAGLDLLDALTTQLSVPPAEAREVAGRLLDAKLQCPLGGEYVFEPSGPRAPAQWTSTALRDEIDPTVAAPGYMAPLLKWFRGIEGQLVQYDQRLEADVVLGMSTE